MRHTAWLIVICLCMAATMGCQRGPDTDTLWADLQNELDVAFEPGLFDVKTFRRMGSATFPAQGDQPGGLHVYYDARLELQRDYSLTSWKGLNVGTLAFVVGATDGGISGIQPGGNAAGDTLSVHGRLSYVASNDAWRPADAATVPAPPPERRTQDTLGSGPRRLLAQIRSALDDAAGRDPAERDGIILDELGTAVAHIDLKLAHLADKRTLGSGPSPGTYHRFGLALSDFAHRSGFALHSYESEGSLENGALLRGELLDFALVQSDVAETLYLGLTENGILPNQELRSVASLWPEAVHLITFESSGIERLADLSGRKIGVGARGSGTRFNVVALSIAAGATIDPPPKIVDVGGLNGISALEAGRIDALFLTSAVPSAALQALAARRADLRFVSLDPAVVHRLAEERFAYYVLEVDARTYPNQAAPFMTLGLAASLVTTEEVSDAAVTRLLEMMVDQASALSDSYFRAGFISPETMRLGLAVPLHPAAERYYEDSTAAQ